MIFSVTTQRYDWSELQVINNKRRLTTPTTSLVTQRRETENKSAEMTDERTTFSSSSLFGVSVCVYVCVCVVEVELNDERPTPGVFGTLAVPVLGRLLLLQVDVAGGGVVGVGAGLQDR